MGEVEVSLCVPFPEDFTEEELFIVNSQYALWSQKTQEDSVVTS